MSSISSKGPNESKEFSNSDTDGNNSDNTKTSTARETFVSSNKNSRRENQRKLNVNKVTEESQSLETSESLDNRETIKTCEILQSDMATELEDLKKSNKSLIWMMEKVTLAAEETKSIYKRKLEKADNYIAELEEDLPSSKKPWTNFELMITQCENEMKKKMEELENLRMDYHKMEMQWKEEITKRDEEIEMLKKENERLKNEKAAVQISTANRTIENNQLIKVSREQKIAEELKKYVVVLYDDFYNSVFEADNVVFVYFKNTDSLRGISYNKVSYHKEMFVLTNLYFSTQYNNRADNAYFNLMSICQQWKTFYPDAEIHVIGTECKGDQHYEPTAQMRQLWTSYNKFILINAWTKDFTKTITKEWSPQCYKLLSG